MNGRDIRDYTQRSYRSTIGMVPQDVLLFNDTIMYNIAYGKLDATETEVPKNKIFYFQEKLILLQHGWGSGEYSLT